MGVVERKARKFRWGQICLFLLRKVKMIPATYGDYRCAFVKSLLQDTAGSFFIYLAISGYCPLFCSILL
ncbi:hypothetical protein SAMN06269173_10252 [Hymenobacter mucosus]|uniref:Uncharacterized protein n=1 Tax=Hymenobacter mucosus TaxID=1411120 RepID=A0A238VYS9_9BACT|nr:hypothetical protein SAMN06269173_10252 [Hymenobacter mucosus]